MAGTRRPGRGTGLGPATEHFGGPELFRLVRFWSRRWASQVVEHVAEHAHVQHVQVVEAVDAVTGSEGHDVTVAAVAHQLGVDRSVASRMIAEAVAAGYVLRKVSTADARRVEVRLTADGARLLAAAHRWQQERFDSLLADWDAADRRRFAQYLRRLATEVAG
ncbi:MAG: winged helix-turn-helix transcriptional regulator [Kutzneria sp.]|nr:winged helix-turn-helix transcriptional regulator [Kutzneria sp.]